MEILKTPHHGEVHLWPGLASSKIYLISVKLCREELPQALKMTKKELESTPKGIAIVSGPNLDIGPSRKVENERRTLLVELGLLAETVLLPI